MVSLYDMSVPIYIRSLENLINVLKAGEKWADENQVSHSKLIEARLASDMKVCYHSKLLIKIHRLIDPI